MRHAATDPHSVDPLTEGLAYLHAAQPDHEQAVYWLRVAADSGNAEGMAMLAYCQLEGLGLPRDLVKARERLERASDGGSLSAKFHLARALVAGWGGAEDAPRAVTLYTAAAALGHADATFNLAGCLYAGWGCQPDRLAAKALYMRARALGSALRAEGLRIRQREIDTVRQLARRFENSSELALLIQERQQEMTLMHDLAHQPAPDKPKMTPGKRRRLLRVASITAVAAGLIAALLGLFGSRAGGPLAQDDDPISIA